MSNFIRPKKLGTIDYCTYVKRLSKYGCSIHPDVDTDYIHFYSVSLYYHGMFLKVFPSPRAAYAWFIGNYYKGPKR